MWCWYSLAVLVGTSNAFHNYWEEKVTWILQYEFMYFRESALSNSSTSVSQLNYFNFSDEENLTKWVNTNIFVKVRNSEYTRVFLDLFLFISSLFLVAVFQIWYSAIPSSTEVECFQVGLFPLGSRRMHLCLVLPSRQLSQMGQKELLCQEWVLDLTDF